jgi:hypothetical protein
VYVCAGEAKRVNESRLNPPGTAGFLEVPSRTRATMLTNYVYYLLSHKVKKRCYPTFLAILSTVREIWWLCSLKKASRWVRQQDQLRTPNLKNGAAGCHSGTHSIIPVMDLRIPWRDVSSLIYLTRAGTDFWHAPFYRTSVPQSTPEDSAANLRFHMVVGQSLFQIHARSPCLYMKTIVLVSPCQPRILDNPLAVWGGRGYQQIFLGQKSLSKSSGLERAWRSRA